MVSVKVSVQSSLFRDGDSPSPPQEILYGSTAAIPPRTFPRFTCRMAPCLTFFPPRVADFPAISKLLLTTKAPDTVEAFEAVRSRLTPGAVVVLLQNGMGNHEEIHSRLKPTQSLLAAITTQGCYRLSSPSSVRSLHASGVADVKQQEIQVIHAVGGTHVGWYPPSASTKAATEPSEMMKEVLSDLAGCGLGATQLKGIDLEERLWRKLAVNCCVNPVALLFDCPNGALLDQYANESKKYFEGVCAEISAVMKRSNEVTGSPEILIEPQDMVNEAQKVISLSRGNLCSMVQDYRKAVAESSSEGSEGNQKVISEIDFINGFVVKKGQELRVPTPWNQQLVDLVKLKFHFV